MAVRFAGLGAAAAAIGAGIVPGLAFDIVHAHDWQAAMAAVYLHFHDGPRPGTVLTVHNLAFQGRYPASLFPRLGLPDSAFTIDGVEYYGDVSFLKGGLSYADRITTVSPTYAREITGVENGMGLDGLLRYRSGVLSGILNGIDDTVWNPATDPLIPARFSPRPAGQARRQQGGAAAAHGPGRASGRAADRRRQPPDLAEGPGHAAGPARRTGGGGHAACRARLRRSGPGAGFRRRRRVAPGFGRMRDRLRRSRWHT